ncbi:molybdenum cofactor guanylyltransferase [Spirulina sp. CS-785/01]|uniref:molybdenum cofactor guanylyltransferase n=1 Tax=Spirulina sp. CS-785/01 TaxID=3021716 RepID=UPI00232AAEC3|nr:molybdenum cofactor guanylyltransferase [Spirulina sp. CS-785/01]MDB9315673.1 molybdenum cofactor guanylyltransferase [Spirulina sp. CS-785/01]
MTDSKKTAIAALILAGGKSSRMGQDKALIPWEGIPLLKRVTDTAKTCCQSVYLLTPWPEKYQDILDPNINTLTENPTGQGSLVAFSQGLEKIAQNQTLDWVFLLACDLPQLDITILQQWQDKLSQLPPEILAVVPQQTVSPKDSYWEGLCAFYRPTILSLLKKYIQNGGRSFQKFLDSLPVHPLVVTPETEAMLFNCNTPKDLK